MLTKDRGRRPQRWPAHGEWRTVLGIDLGFHPDPPAFVVAANHTHDARLFVLQTWKQWRMDFSDVAAKVRDFQQRHDPDTIVIDNANAQGVDEMQRRHGIPLVAAAKVAMVDRMMLLNDDFVAGRVVIDPTRCNRVRQDTDAQGRCVLASLELVAEMEGLVWEPRKVLFGKREEHPGCANNLADALLYAWRFAYPYLSSPEPRRPALGAPEALQAEVDRGTGGVGSAQGRGARGAR